MSVSGKAREIEDSYKRFKRTLVTSDRDHKPTLNDQSKLWIPISEFKACFATPKITRLFLSGTALQPAF